MWMAWHFKISLTIKWFGKFKALTIDGGDFQDILWNKK
jgi:hypothetical protein